MSDTSGFTITGMDELRRKLGLMGAQKDLDRVIGNAFRKIGRRIQAQARKEARTKGVMRTVFGKSPSGSQKLFTVSRLLRQGGELTATLKVKGLAAIQETGGRTLPHRILRPWGRDKPIMHPGAQHPRMPSFEPIFHRQQATAFSDVADAVAGHLEVAARG